MITTVVLALWFAVLVANIVAGTWFNMLVAGWMLGIGYMITVQWYLDRKVNREIMKEIDTLSRNYDNHQLNLFDRMGYDFPENLNSKEVTKND